MEKPLFKYFDSFTCDLGNFALIASNKGLQAVTRIKGEISPNSNPNVHTNQAKQQLQEYFNKERKTFDLTYDLEQYTDFQQEVWAHLCDTKYGKTYSYKELSILCGDVNKVRAVGRANGANPIPIIIPCHRIIGSNGQLVGYSGGLDMKQYLLEFEGAEIQLNLF